MASRLPLRMVFKSLVLNRKGRYQKDQLRRPHPRSVTSGKWEPAGKKCYLHQSSKTKTQNWFQEQFSVGTLSYLQFYDLD